MTDELFSIEPVKSPRLRWMERHHLTLELITGDGPYGPNSAKIFQAKHGMKVIGTGPTGGDALCAAAKSLNIKLWNEE